MTSVRLEFGPDISVECPHAPSPVVNTRSQKELAMKKALTLVVLIISPFIVLAQGTVTFWNQTGLVQQWTSVSDTTLIPVPKNGGYVEMFSAAPSAAAPTALFSAVTGGQTANYTTLAAFLAANTAWSATPGDVVPAPMWIFAGLFNGGTYTIEGIPAAGNAQYFAVGWTGSATTFDQAIASGTAFMGESAIFTTATADFFGNPETPISLRLTFGGMTLTPIVVPEPTTVLLAALGAVLLLLFRRRG